MTFSVTQKPLNLLVSSLSLPSENVWAQPLFSSVAKNEIEVYGKAISVQRELGSNHQEIVNRINEKASPICDYEHFPFNHKTGFNSVHDLLTALVNKEKNIIELCAEVYSSMFLTEPKKEILANIPNEYINPTCFDPSGVIALLEDSGFIKYQAGYKHTVCLIKLNEVNLPYSFVSVKIGDYSDKDRLVIGDVPESLCDKIESLVLPQYIKKEKIVPVFKINGFKESNYGRIASVTTEYLDKDIQLARKEFYPWFEADFNQYFTEFFASNSTTLVLIGDPGTGKSTLIRTIIYALNVKAVLAYKPSVMMDQDFIEKSLEILKHDLRVKQPKAIVVEDADTMMAKRSDGNFNMGELLNSTNGICSDPTNKFILSTNLDSLDDIDPALLRPGRCFDVLCFRPLTAEQANIARVSAGMEPKVYDPQKHYKLAEILNNNSTADKSQATIKPRFGFINK